MHSNFPQLALPELLDIHGRTFKNLRVSLTEVCNLACVYCVEKPPKWTQKPTNNLDNLVTSIQALHQILKLETIRLTGGEPTLFTSLVPLVAEISKLGISLKMTTNGLSLPSLAPSLRQAGLQSVNVSLDAIDPSVFEKVTRNRHLATVLAGIDASLKEGLEVKLNAVILKGWNEHQILPLLDFARSRGVEIRFLELMRMGHLHSQQFENLLFPQKEILEKIEALYTVHPLPRDKAATSTYWQLEDGSRFGIIANESAPFCSDCNRLRLDSIGNIYGCLSENTPISIKDDLQNTDILIKKLREALAHKQTTRFEGSDLSMMEIGG